MSVCRLLLRRGIGVFGQGLLCYVRAETLSKTDQLARCDCHEFSIVEFVTTYRIVTFDSDSPLQQWVLKIDIKNIHIRHGYHPMRRSSTSAYSLPTRDNVFPFLILLHRKSDA
jgi:hypothetical protein